jgi:YidC/Oxa1 family membrane protein insertase
MNNEKRLLLAITLSLLIVTGWSFAISKLYPQKKQLVTSTIPVAQQAQESKIAVAPSWPVSSQVKLSLPDQDLAFELPYAVLSETIFKDYQNTPFLQTIGFLLPDKDIIYRASQIGQKISFVYEDANKRITKEFSPLKSKYNLELSITVANLGSSVLNFDYPLVIGEVSIQNGHFSERLKEIFFGEKEKTVHLSPFRNYSTSGEITFAGIRDRYFCVVVQPEQSGYTGYIKKIGKELSEMGLKYPLQILPGQTQRLNFHIYLGPQDLQLLNASHEGWGAVVYYGVFDPIAKGIMTGLRFIEKIVGNWGLTLILLSVAIYFLLYPLSIKQMRSMKKMQEIQPKVEQLRAKYKKDANELNKKVLELYQKERVNPFSGCLPMILQIPIFFALYQGLIRSLELKGSSFLWIKDLSEPDKLISFSQAIPLVGKDINILPVLMAVLMFFQQKMTLASSGANSSAAEQQKMMMYIMPVLFGVIFYNMPSGLVIYWFVNSLLMLIFQLRMAKPTAADQGIIDV